MAMHPNPGMLRLQLAQLEQRLAQNPDDERLRALATKIRRLIELSESTCTPTTRAPRTGAPQKQTAARDIEPDVDRTPGINLPTELTAEKARSTDIRSVPLESTGALRKASGPAANSKDDEEQRQKQQSWLQFSSRFSRK